MDSELKISNHLVVVVAVVAYFVLQGSDPDGV